jgi:hypothetical protein
LWHGEDVNYSYGVVIHKFSQHQTHDLHRYTCAAVPKHLEKCERGDVNSFGVVNDVRVLEKVVLVGVFRSTRSEVSVSGRWPWVGGTSGSRSASWIFLKGQENEAEELRSIWWIVTRRFRGLRRLSKISSSPYKRTHAVDPIVELMADTSAWSLDEFALTGYPSSARIFVCHLHAQLLYKVFRRFSLHKLLAIVDPAPPPTALHPCHDALAI